MDLSRYDVLRPLIKTGDVCFFSQAKGESSKIIRKFTNSMFSHCGLFIWAELPDSTEPRLLIIESTSLNRDVDVSGEFKSGIQMVSASQRLGGYEGKGWWGSLKVPLTDLEKQNMSEWLFSRYTSSSKYAYKEAILSGISDKSYCKGLIGWFNHFLYKLLGPKQTDFHQLFCSELLSKSLQIANRIPITVNPVVQTPEDVSKFDCFNPLVPLFISDVIDIKII